MIAGTWRGRKLLSPRGNEVRPTADRVKEAMFSILGPEVKDSLVLDLCCGAGGLAIEALSRGARRAILVDSSRTSLDLARKNLSLCSAEAVSFDLVKADAVSFFKNWGPPPAGPWVLLADPPYHSPVVESILEQLVTCGPESGFAMAILEHGQMGAIAESKSGQWRIRNRKYGKTCLTVVRPG